MGVGRLAPHRIRAAYAKALGEIPLPVRSRSGLDARALTMFAEASVGGRRLEFGTLAAMPRLWVAFADVDPPVLGYVTGLAAGAPELHITETMHCEWARSGDHGSQIKREAAAVWQRLSTECEG
jgi:hypothetical protein